MKCKTVINCRILCKECSYYLYNTLGELTVSNIIYIIHLVNCFKKEELMGWKCNLELKDQKAKQ